MGLKLRLVFLLSFTLSSLVKCECPDEWTSNAGSCYVVIDKPEDWVRANDVCKLFVGYLAEITSSAENDFAKRFAKNKNVGDVWIGGNDLLSNGKWQWVESGQRLSFTDWAPGEPYAARCVQMWADKSFQWDDIDCDDKNAFLCEHNPEEVIG